MNSKQMNLTMGGLFIYCTYVCLLDMFMRFICFEFIIYIFDID